METNPNPNKPTHLVAVADVLPVYLGGVQVLVFLGTPVLVQLGSIPAGVVQNVQSEGISYP